MSREETERMLLVQYMEQRFAHSKQRILYFDFMLMVTIAVLEAEWVHAVTTSPINFAPTLRYDLLEAINDSVVFEECNNREYVCVAECSVYDALITLDRRHTIDTILADLADD